MSNAIFMSTDFERQKNTQATIYTVGVAVALLLLFIWIKWDNPVENNPPMTQEVVDINLGSGDQGSGHDQPQLPGDPAPAQRASYSPPTPIHAVAQSVKDVSSDETEKEAPPVVKPAVSRPDATKINEESKVVKTTNTSTQPVATPAPPRPKALMGKVMGGNGNGGNGADSYKPGGNEGIAGGNGDQGRPGGNPNGKSYTGAPRNFGVKVLSIPNQSFEDDFNQNAKVAMDIVVDENGHVTSATFQPRGSTISDRRYIDIAERSARQLKWGPSDGGQKGTVIFNFKVRG
jgi:hypothetical protein